MSSGELPAKSQTRVINLQASIVRQSGRGRLVIVGGETGGRWLGGLDRQLRAVLLSPFVGQRLGFFVTKENAADLAALRDLIEAGRVTPAVDTVYPLAETAAAIRQLIDGKATGKLVVAVG